jgi:O-acetyl-ADP-ribose deacetylase (regulator of RNase III)
VIGSGVDSVIHHAAGPKLIEERQKIGRIPVGNAVLTDAYSLDAKYVAHTVGPIWEGGNGKEQELLRNCYANALDLAVKKKCESIAFPLLASGNHGFPKNKALQAAITAFSGFLMEHDMQIYLVVFSKDSVQLSEKLVHNVRSYIDERYVAAFEAETYGGIDARSRQDRYKLRRYMELREEKLAMPCAAEVCEEASWFEDLDTFLKKKDAGFVETLKDLIKQSGQKNSTIYKRANMSKQHFSKLINNPDSVPTKATAISLALALRLSLAQTQDLIGRAGYALTNSSVFDLIIQYHIQHKIYNVIEINIVLYDFDQSLLGS